MEKRYQVFVSSTYTDLIEERNEAMQALLELECMPSGMELFPAANETQWNWIKKVIDESDYYILIVGGRYGSVSPSKGISYTEMEYRYALETKKPIISFVHEDISKLPSGKCEQDHEKKKKLEAFIELVQQKLCKFYNSPSDLGAKLSRSITQLRKQYPATGWIRADVLKQFGSSDEILKLRKENEKLKEQISLLSNEPLSQTSHLASGDEEFEVEYYYKIGELNPKTNRYRKVGEGDDSVLLSWNQMLFRIAPMILRKVPQYHWRQNVISELVDERVNKYLEEKHPDKRCSEIGIYKESLDTIYLQFRALGILEIDEEGDWILTNYGDNYFSRIAGVLKGETKIVQQ